MDNVIKSYEVSRYSNPHNILRSETIYGSGFQSPGGLDSFKAGLLSKMSLTPEMKLLEIGSGLGGAAFHLASTYGVQITGVDVSETMITLANERNLRFTHSNKVNFILGDIFSGGLGGQTFNLIYSQDSLMYVADKKSAFQKCITLLPPGGSIYISDFIKIKGSQEFDQYAKRSGHSLPDLSEYMTILSQSGFKVVLSEDTSQEALLSLKTDLEHYRFKIKSDSISISTEDEAHIVERWLRKINFLNNGLLGQNRFIAKKPK